MPGLFLAAQRRRKSGFLDPTAFSSPTNRWRADSIVAPGAVASWVDSIGAVNITAAGAARPTRGTNATNGKATVTFDGVANVLAAAAFVRAQPSTLVLFGDNIGYNVAGRILDSAGTVIVNQFKVPEQLAIFAGGGGFDGYNGSAPRATPFYLVAHFAGAGSTTQLDNGVLVAAANAGATGFAGAFNVGGNAGFFAHCEIQEMLFYAGALTPTQLTQMSEYALGYYGITRVWKDKLIAMGDSIDAGFGVPVGDDWPADVVANLGAAWGASTNYALSGNTIPNCDAQAAVNVDNTIDASFDRMVETMGAGINDVVTSLDSLATIQTNMTTYCTNRRAAAAAAGVTNLKIVIRNLLSCGAAFAVPAKEAVRESWNAYIATPAGLAAIGADACIDVTLDPLIGAPMAFGDLTYFQVDQTHPTAAGQARIAALAAPVLAGL